MESMLLILDLDETLIHATEGVPAPSADFIFGSFHVLFRPHVRDFLEYCRASFRVAVWTSASADYAAAIVGRVFGPGFPLEFLWARERCTLAYDKGAHEREWIKNLAKVKRRGFPLERVIMVDDSPAKLARNYGNLVRVTPFEGNAEDDELPLLQRYLHALKEVPNIRAVEKRGWRSGLPQELGKLPQSREKQGEGAL